MGICTAVKFASEKYSKAVENRYTKLFESVQGMELILMNFCLHSLRKLQ